MSFVALLTPHRDAGRSQGLDDMDDVHLPRERPGEQSEFRQARPALKGDRRLAVLEKESLADEVRYPVEEPVDPLEAQIRHPDLVGVRESERHPIGPAAVW